MDIEVCLAYDRLQKGWQSGTALDVCRNCGKKQFDLSARKCRACRIEQRKDGTLVTVPDGYLLDECGNVRSKQEIEIRDGKLIISYQYLLESGKITLRGEYPKLENPPKCLHPERLSCNYGDGFDRCELMKYSSGKWVCMAGSI